MKRIIVLIAGLMLAGMARAASVGVDWDANTDSDLAGYTVYYATYSLTTMTTAQATVPSIHTLAAGPMSVKVSTTVAGLLDDTSYYFRLTAYDTSGNVSDWGLLQGSLTDVELSTCTPPPHPPVAPGTPVLTVLSASQIQVSWADNSNNETGFRVERSPDSGFTTVNTATTTNANVTSFTDSGLSASTLYYYRVVAFNAIGETASVSSFATTQAPPSSSPVQPSNLRQISATPNQIVVGWNDNSTDETAFQLQWAPAATGPWTSFPDLAPNMTNYTHGSLSGGTTYYYHVRAVNGVGNPAYSAALAAMTQDNVPPAAPPSLSSGTVTATSVSLSWGASSDVGTGVVKYWVYRNGVIVATVTAPRSFTDTGRSPRTAYTYTVKAVDNAGNVSTASTLPVTTAGGLIGPSGVTLVETAAFPNPAVGVDPTIRAFVGNADTLEVTIYDASGSVVHSDRVSGGPTGTASNGQPYHDYVWSKNKASGVYFAVVHGKKGGDVIRGRVKFIVVR